MCVLTVSHLFSFQLNAHNLLNTYFYHLLSMFYLFDEWKTNLMSLAILFHFLCAQHVSDISISIFRRLRLCWWITTSVVLFSVRCVLEFLLRLVFGGVGFAGWSTMSETCWAHKKWNKIANDIKFVFHSSTIAMMHGPINISFIYLFTNRCTSELS